MEDEALFLKYAAEGLKNTAGWLMELSQLKDSPSTTLPNERGQHMAFAVGASAKDIATDRNAAAQRDELKREHQATLAQIEDRLTVLYLERDELKSALEHIAKGPYPSSEVARKALASLKPTSQQGASR